MSNTHLILPQIKTYEEALLFIDSLDVSAMKLGLSRIRKLLATLGNPQDTLPMIHIGGSNGKGSTTAMLDAVLKASGHKVGRFTSPHLVHVRERITLNGAPILPDDFTRLTDRLKRHLEHLGWDREDWPTYFEFLNVLAYLYFQEKAVDMTIFEVGLGGRLDSTNVVQQPNLTIITGISLEHTQHLGHTLTEIAAEKAGILKSGVPVVLGPQFPPKARDVILEKAHLLEAPVAEATLQGFHILPESSLEAGLLIQTPSGNVQLPLLGTYQQTNLATVFTALEVLRTQGLHIPHPVVAEGLRHASWPARFQYLKSQHILLDGSHNPEGFQSLQLSLQQYLNDSPLYWLVSLRNNREIKPLVKLMAAFPKTQGVIMTQGQQSHLYHPPSVLAVAISQALPDTCPVLCFEDNLEAFRMLQRILGNSPKTYGVITGSLYTAGHILEAV